VLPLVLAFSGFESVSRLRHVSTSDEQRESLHCFAWLHCAALRSASLRSAWLSSIVYPIPYLSRVPVLATEVADTVMPLLRSFECVESRTDVELVRRPVSDREHESHRLHPDRWSVRPQVSLQLKRGLTDEPLHRAQSVAIDL
jgi:hypothetical protein